jgi:hypothetical protein
VEAWGHGSSETPASPLATKPLHVGALPHEGVAVETERLGKPTLTLVGLDGHVNGRLKLALDADSQLLRNVVVVRNPRTGRRYVLDALQSRLVAYTKFGGYPRLLASTRDPKGCALFARLDERRFLLCGGDGPTSIDVLGRDGRRRIAGIPPHSRHPPLDIGFWRSAYLSPDGRTVLAQWSAECEVPTAFFADGRRLRAVTGERDWRKAPESVALDWSSAGKAVVQLFEGACGYGYRDPGVYLIDPRTGAHQLVYTTRRSFAEMWKD